MFPKLLLRLSAGRGNGRALVFFLGGITVVPVDVVAVAVADTRLICFRGCVSEGESGEGGWGEGEGRGVESRVGVLERGGVSEISNRGAVRCGAVPCCCGRFAVKRCQVENGTATAFSSVGITNTRIHASADQHSQSRNSRVHARTAVIPRHCSIALSPISPSLLSLKSTSSLVSYGLVLYSFVLYGLVSYCLYLPPPRSACRWDCQSVGSPPPPHLSPNTPPAISRKQSLRIITPPSPP